MTPAPVTVLFARPDSVYKALPGCDVFDIHRDARTWVGGTPVVAHPPCRAWGRLRAQARPRSDERELAIFAVAQVQRWGGVLEHPQCSTLWPVAMLPGPGSRDCFGGFTLPVLQWWFGHRAEKATWLYIVGCEPSSLPALPPLRLGEPTHVIAQPKRRPGQARKLELCKSAREHTPRPFAQWLLTLARSTKGGARA